MFEHKGEEILSRAEFLLRLLRSVCFTLLIVAVSLAIGSAGYHHFEGLAWVDALLNAAMILTGMGPVTPMQMFPETRPFLKSTDLPCGRTSPRCPACGRSTPKPVLPRPMSHLPAPTSARTGGSAPPTGAAIRPMATWFRLLSASTCRSLESADKIP